MDPHLKDILGVVPSTLKPLYIHCVCTVTLHKSQWVPSKILNMIHRTYVLLSKTWRKETIMEMARPSKWLCFSAKRRQNVVRRPLTEQTAKAGLHQSCTFLTLLLANT